MMDRILIVEDETKISEVLRTYLENAGYATHILDDGRAVADWVREEKPALIVLDIMLPGKDGLEICREIRAFSLVPIIMVTARVEEIDRLLGLEMGADDYVCKPFSPREVVARVKANLRRSVVTGIRSPRAGSTSTNCGTSPGSTEKNLSLLVLSSAYCWRYSIPPGGFCPGINYSIACTMISVLSATGRSTAT